MLLLLLTSFFSRACVLCFSDNASPKWETSLRVESSGADTPLMLSLYQMNEGAELSADDQIGAATTSMQALVSATEEQPLRLPLIRGEAILPDAEVVAFVRKI